MKAGLAALVVTLLAAGPALAQNGAPAGVARPPGQAEAAAAPPPRAARMTMAIRAGTGCRRAIARCDRRASSIIRKTSKMLLVGHGALRIPQLRAQDRQL